MSASASRLPEPSRFARIGALALAAGVVLFWLIATVLVARGRVQGFDLVNYYLPLYEVTFGRLEKVKGMNVSIVTTARSDDESRALLELMGMPFRKG